MRVFKAEVKAASEINLFQQTLLDSTSVRKNKRYADIKVGNWTLPAFGSDRTIQHRLDTECDGIRLHNYQLEVSTSDALSRVGASI